MKLLIFTFSPIQSFIASSRKLLDLFNASYILSYLTESLIEHINQNSLGEVIYPVYGQKRENLAGYPNRLVVKTEKDLCGELSEVFEKTWSQIYLSVRTALGLQGRASLQFEKHADSYFKTFCHCMDFVDRQGWLQKMSLERPCGEADDYGYTYDLVERYLGAKKSFRPYRGLVDEETYEGKYPDGCTQCGEYPALAIDWQEFRKSLPKSKRRLLSGKEKLCGVCLTKRFAMEFFRGLKGLKEIDFPSTKNLAWAPLIAKLAEDRKKQENLDIIRSVETQIAYILERPHVEIHKVEADFLDPQDVKEMGKEDPDPQLQELLEILEQLYEIHKYKRPERSYFAILMADGDNMGVWLGLRGRLQVAGREVLLRDRPLTEDFHRDFSKRLFNYSLQVQKRAEEEEVFLKLVYAGGDDVLAVGYPANLIRFAMDIRKLFSEKVYPDATLSAGLVIGHEKENLRFLLEEVREAEKQAKREGKDRLCLSVVTRNSSPVRVVLRWENLPLLELLTGYFSKRLLSSNLPYALREELWLLKNQEKESDFRKGLVSALVRRILRRRKHKSLEEGQIEELMRRLEPFIEDVDFLAKLFYVARFIGMLEERSEAVSV